jgi:cellulose synthase (UDP-forming)
VPDDDFNHDHLFYGHMQPGKNACESAISCGSGVIYRRSALAEIGGFQEWNIVEDFYTSYVMNQHGYKNIYVSQAYTKGEAPTDLKTIYKQRGTWALDTLRMFFWKQPILNTSLTVRQRLLYFETGYIYLVSAIVIPSLYILNFYSLYNNTPILNVGLWYLVFRLPSFFLIMKVYNDLGQGSANSRMWTGLFPVFLYQQSERFYT